MKAIGQLLITVSTLSILGGIAASLPLGKHHAQRIRTITGLFILLVILKPLSSMSGGTFNLDLEQFSREGNSYARQGQDLSESNRADIISKSLSAYIEIGAADYGLQLEVKVTLSEADACTPQSVTLWGSWTQEQKDKLTSDITREIGIPKERQQWILRK